jgi:hypothetical protein
MVCIYTILGCRLTKSNPVESYLDRLTEMQTTEPRLHSTQRRTKMADVCRKSVHNKWICAWSLLTRQTVFNLTGLEYFSMSAALVKRKASCKIVLKEMRTYTSGSTSLECRSVFASLRLCYLSEPVPKDVTVVPST